MALSDGRAADNYGTQSGKIGICLPVGRRLSAGRRITMAHKAAKFEICVPAGRRLTAGQRELLICTAANSEKRECGRTTFLADTAAIGKRRSCGRTDCAFIRPQIAKRGNAAVPSSLPIRPQMKKDRAAAVRIAHLDGRKQGKGGMRPYYPPYRYGRNWKKTELRPCGVTAAANSRFVCQPGAVSRPGGGKLWHTKW